MTLNLTTTEGYPIQSKFQVCDVSRPLWSVGKICDNGNQVLFTHDTAVVKHPKGEEVCVFKRQPGGLYVAKLKLLSPFIRPDQ